MAAEEEGAGGEEGMAKPVVVGKYQYDYEAQMARVALEGEGIDSIILSDNAGGMLPGLQLLFPARLAVHPDDADRAREILAELRG